MNNNELKYKIGQVTSKLWAQTSSGVSNQVCMQVKDRVYTLLWDDLRVKIQIMKQVRNQLSE